MPNKNYLRGVRFERERLKHYQGLGQDAVRTAGSHGTWDIVSTDWARGIVTHIQCKTVASKADADRMIEKFRSNPPFPPKAGCHQRLEVKVKGSTDILGVTI